MHTGNNGGTRAGRSQYPIRDRRLWACVVRCRDVRGMSFKEIAERYRLSLVTAWRIYHESPFRPERRS